MLHEGDIITIDGSTGNVYPGEIATVEAEFFGELATLLSWADEVARLEVMANADTPRDAERARKYGAMGIGLCRTERMFNDPQRLPIVQDMILADTTEERQAALDKLLPIQREDFKGIFKAMAGLPVTVRLLDPPMHEFLPTVSQLEFEIAPPAPAAARGALDRRVAGNAAPARPGAAARRRRRPRQAADESREVPRVESRPTRRSRGARRCCARCTR